MSQHIMCAICHKRQARVGYSDERRHMHDLDICYTCWGRHLWLWFPWATRMIEHAREMARGAGEKP